MLGINKVTLMGNLGADPELRHTKDKGLPVCNFQIATTTHAGQKEETVWHRVVVFGKLAESCQKYLSKGRPVYLEGRISTNKWTDKDGVTRYNQQVIVENLRFLGSKPQDVATSESVSAEEDEALTNEQLF
jgi:single-strand DNA-binding protein